MIKKLINFFRKKHQHKWKRDGEMFLKCSCGAEAVYFGDQSNVGKDEVKGFQIK
jgi:hypothetical protein